MGFKDNTVVTRTVSCDNAACGKTITHDRNDNTIADKEENAWMRTLRLIQSVDGRAFVYCSDVCEIEGIKSGQHNPPQKKTIIEDASPAALNGAIQSAEAARQSDQNLKRGTGGPVLVRG